MIPIVAPSGDIPERQATAILAQGASAAMGADDNESKQGLPHATELWPRTYSPGKTSTVQVLVINK